MVEREDPPPGAKPRHAALRRALLLSSLAGAAFFTGVFGMSHLNPLLIERAAREVIRLEVERRVGEKLDDLSASRVAVLAQKALGKTDAEIEAVRREIADSVPSKVADAVADMTRAGCECRKRLRALAQRSHDEKLSSLSQLRERLAHFVESAYAEVSAKLLREIRIFTAANAAVFALLAWVTRRRRAAALQLALPAIVLVGAASITGYLYLFQQDWLHTILFNQYVGWAYGGYLGLAIALLSDVVFNRARVSTGVINLALNAVGSATVVVSPC